MAEESSRNRETNYNFFESPDTIDFITRYDPYVSAELNTFPQAYVGKIVEGAYTVVYVPREYTDEALRNVAPNSISVFPLVLGLMGMEDLEASGIPQVWENPQLPLTGEGVLMGFVDTGIDYTLPAFRNADGSTKIKAIWDQTETGTGRSPNGFLIGTEYNEPQINEALVSGEPYTVVPQRDTVGHGTFLASAAASSEEGEYRGAAPDAELIVVKLRKANEYHLERNMVPPEQENAFASTDIMMGIEYIVERAIELGRPVSICLGLGCNGGGHDGLNPFEEFLTRTGNRPGVAICVAGGNEALARHHTQGTLHYQGANELIEVKSEEGDRGINLQIWNEASDRFSVSIRSPAGELISRIPAKAGTTTLTNLVLEKSHISVQYFFPVPGRGSQLTWIKIVDPTPGIWQIRIYGDIVINGSYHAWLPITGFTDTGVEFLTPVPNFTITEPATAISIITVGAYSARSKGVYVNSSWGPTRFQLSAPDFVAPGSDVGGIFPTGYGRMSGTSAAAAIAAGAAALLLQYGIVEGQDISVNTPLIRSYLIWGCERDAGGVYPNEQWGYGRLNLYETLRQLQK